MPGCQLPSISVYWRAMSRELWSSEPPVRYFRHGCSKGARCHVYREVIDVGGAQPGRMTSGGDLSFVPRTIQFEEAKEQQELFEMGMVSDR